MNKIDRYFYIPEKCVEDVTTLATARRNAHRQRVEDFLNKVGTELAGEYDSGRICDLAFEIDQLIPKGWRVTERGAFRGRTVQRAVPDLRSKEGKAFKAELHEINLHAVSPHAEILAVAHKYGLNIVRVIQEHTMRSFYGGYYSHCKAFLLAVPATGDRALSPDYIVPPEITEITESQFIAITKEDGCLNSKEDKK